MKKDFNPAGFFWYTTNMAAVSSFFFYTNNKPSKSHVDWTVFVCLFSILRNSQLESDVCRKRDS